MLLEKEVSKASIAKIVGISRTTLHHLSGPESSSRWVQMADRRGSVLRAYFYSDLVATLKCIIKHLHTELVKKHHFKIRDGYGRDPRPFLNTAISNWEEDERRKRTNQDGDLREVPLDYEAVLEIPDPTSALEDSVLENIAYEELKREFRGLRYHGDDDEFDLFCAYHVDERPLDEFRERLRIPSKPAQRQRLSRANKSIVAARDSLFTLLLTSFDFWMNGELPQFRLNPKITEQWAERVKGAV